MAAALAHLSDGSSLHTSWNAALADAIQHFKQLLTAQSSRSWKHLNAPIGTPSISSNATSKEYPFGTQGPGSKGRPAVTTADVQLDRRTNKSGDVFRGTLEVPLSDELGSVLNVELIRAVLETPELRSLWDRLVEEASTLDLLDVNTKVVQTKYKLGWPASPRDSITIAKLFNDDRNVVQITTSLPRSPNEPAYLRPSPPHVRAHVNLLAYCVQFIPEPISSTLSPTRSARGKPSVKPKTNLKITCYWQWDPKGSFLVGGWIPQHMPTLLVSFYTFLQGQLAASLPTISGYGKHISVDRVHYDVGRGALNVDYAIVKEETSPVLLGRTNDAHHAAESKQNETEGRIAPLQDKGKAMRTLDFAVPASSHWDVQLNFKSPADSAEPYVPVVQRAATNVIPYHTPRLNFRVSHGALPALKEIVRVSVSLERTAGENAGLRINGIPVTITEAESEAPVNTSAGTHLFDDAASISDLSTFSNDVSEARSVMGVSLEEASGQGAGPVRPRLLTSPSMMSFRGRSKRSRTPVEEKHIGSMIKRNYIYFTSLLQEPEAKWNALSETRGVALHQLKSIDPTVVVYRAESTVVGASLWDVYSVIATWGCRAAWDKAYEDSLLLEDLGECTELWQVKSRQSWPAPARESILLRTTYRSENSIHVFGLSTFDRNLFPSIPASDDVTRVRVHTELHAWALERLSPNTVQITAIDQYDSNSSLTRSSTQQALTNAVAGVRDTALRGTPPIISRIGTGLRVVLSSYDVEAAHARFEYAPVLLEKSAAMTKLSVSIPSERPPETPTGSPSPGDEIFGEKASRSIATEKAYLECEIRCEESWAMASTELLVDPPPIRIAALRRHRLSPHGGLWLTIEHDRTVVTSEGVNISIRRDTTGEPSSRSSLKLNGSPIKVDSEDISPEDVQVLKRQKRGIPARLPLDRPPVASPKLRRTDTSVGFTTTGVNTIQMPPRAWLETPGIKQIVMPLTYSVKLGNAMLASGGGKTGDAMVSPSMAAASALKTLGELHEMRDGESTTAVAWAAAYRMEGYAVERKMVSAVSTTAYTFRSGRIVEGFGAEELLTFLTASRRSVWNSTVSADTDLLAYAHGTSATFYASATPSMFRQRGFLTATGVGRYLGDGTVSPSNAVPTRGNAILIASKSFDEESITAYADPSKYNPLNLPLGKLSLEGWILEELDPYAHDKYEIPSTRVIYVSCVEYGGSMPAAYGNMLASGWPANLGRAMTAAKLQRYAPSLRSPGLGYLMEKGSISMSARSAAGGDDYGSNRNLLKAQLTNPNQYILWVLLSPASIGEPKSIGLEKFDRGVAVSGLPTSPARTSSGTLLDLAARLREVAALRNLPVAEFTVESSGPAESFDIEIQSMFLEPASSAIAVDFTGPLSKAELPCAISVHQGTSPLRTVQSDVGATPRSFSVRVQLDFPQSDVGDPLTGKHGRVKQAEEHPDLARVNCQGALVRICLTRRANAEPTGKAGQGRSWTRDGEAIEVRDALLSVPDKGRLLRLKDVMPLFSAESIGPRLPLGLNAAVARAKTSTKLESTEVAAIAPSIVVIAEPAVKAKDIPEPAARPSPIRSISMYERWGMVLPRRLAKVQPAPTEIPPAKEEAVEPTLAGTTPSPPSTPLEANTEASQHLGSPHWSNRITRPEYSIIALILVASVAFLLGSLVRGFLQLDEDFIMFGSLDAGPRLSESEWKVLRKIAGLKAFGWNIVLGAYRANQGR